MEIQCSLCNQPIFVGATHATLFTCGHYVHPGCDRIYNKDASKCRQCMQTGAATQDSGMRQTELCRQQYIPQVLGDIDQLLAEGANNSWATRLTLAGIDIYNLPQYAPPYPFDVLNNTTIQPPPTITYNSFTVSQMDQMVNNTTNGFVDEFQSSLFPGSIPPLEPPEVAMIRRDQFTSAMDPAAYRGMVASASVESLREANIDLIHGKFMDILSKRLVVDRSGTNRMMSDIEVALRLRSEGVAFNDWINVYKSTNPRGVTIPWLMEEYHLGLMFIQALGATWSQIYSMEPHVDSFKLLSDVDKTFFIKHYNLNFKDIIKSSICMAHETVERMKKFLKLNLNLSHMVQLGVNATDVMIMGGPDCIVALINLYPINDLISRLGFGVSHIRCHPDYRTDYQLRKLWSVLGLSQQQIRMLVDTVPRYKGTGLMDSTCGSKLSSNDEEFLD